MAIAPIQISKNALDSAINPYNFVPLSRHVFVPVWGDAVSHDHPFEDGWCGHIGIEIEAVTPLLIGADQQAPDGARSPDRKPIQMGGKYVVPSTSLQGMVRNVVEIASFGRLARGVEERRLAMRNVDDSDYKAMVPAAGFDRSGHKIGIEAGWLFRATNGWEIEPCDFARLDRNDKIFPPGREPWFNPASSNFSDKGLPTQAGIEVFESDSGGFSGIAVRTGFIQPRFGQKREYVFFTPPGASIQIGDELFASFKAAHGTNPAWCNQRDGSAGEYQRKVLNGEKIPVFYVPDPTGKVASFGLAAMFRVMMPTSLHGAIPQTPPAVPNGSPDLAALMFGQHDAVEAASPERKIPLRGRVSFSHAFAQPAPVPSPSDEVQAVLSSPNPTFNPAYIQQTAGSNEFKSLMKAAPTLSGWKRYPVGGGPKDRAPPLLPMNKAGEENLNVRTKLCPLPAGTQFKGTVHVHNLRLVELGALLWAIGWGRSEFFSTPTTPDYLHSLGMGKPFGLGQVRVKFSIQDAALKANDGAATTGLARRAIDQFMAEMDSFRMTKGEGNWVDSKQITELLAIANPQTVASKEGRIGYLNLEQHREVKPTTTRGRRPLARHSSIPTQPDNGGTWGVG